MKRFREIRFRQRDEPDKPKAEVAEAKPEHKVHSWKQRIEDFYFDHYKSLLIIPFVLLILALGQIGYQIATTGDFLIKGVSLKGGATISFTADKPIDLLKLQEELIRESGNHDINVRKMGSTGVIIEAGIFETQQIDSFVQLVSEKTGTDKSLYSVDIMGSSLGKSFFQQAFLAMVLAFLLMAVVVFVIFRTLVPSLAIILSAFCDIVIAVAVVNLMGVKISTAGIAAFLMLIGYSVDTDILLTIRVLKRKEGTVRERIISSIKTGMTMTLTAIASTIVVLIFSRSEVLTQIMTILLIGLVADLINTWIQNVGILRIYVERKKHEQV